MSKVVKVTLAPDLKAQLDYEANLLKMTSNQYAAHLVTQSLTTPLSKKNEVHETLHGIHQLLNEATELLIVLKELNHKDE